VYLAYLPSLPQSRFIYNNAPVYGIKKNLRFLNIRQCKTFLVSINYFGKLLKISSGKNLQGIRPKTSEIEACLLHFPQSYLASMNTDLLKNILWQWIEKREKLHNLFSDGCRPTGVSQPQWIFIEEGGYSMTLIWWKIWPSKIPKPSYIPVEQSWWCLVLFLQGDPLPPATSENWALGLSGACCLHVCDDSLQSLWSILVPLQQKIKVQALTVTGDGFYTLTEKYRPG